MAIGPFFRSLLGPFERSASDAYRAIFVDLGALVRQIKLWVPAEKIKILEIGCGEGIFTSHLAKAYQDAQIAGIDITDRVGRIYKGDSKRVSFKRQTIKDFAVDNTCGFDLVVIIDVMHHIPIQMHVEFLEESRKVLRPGGKMVIKEWMSNFTPIHFLTYFSDRYITGDRIQYKTTEEWRSLIKGLFGERSLKDEVYVGPWSGNKVFLVQF